MVFEENEVVMLLLGVGVLLFMLLRWPQLKQLPASKNLVMGFMFLLASSFYYQFLNYLEHFCYAGSAVTIAFWSWRAFAIGKEA